MSTEATSQQSVVPDDSPDAAAAAEIAEVSPEGVPAHPEMGSRQIGLLLASIIVGLFVIALAIAALASPLAGVVLGGVALLLFVGNPAVWAALFRAKERREVDTDRASPPRTGGVPLSGRRTRRHRDETEDSMRRYTCRARTTN